MVLGFHAAPVPGPPRARPREEDVQGAGAGAFSMGGLVVCGEQSELGYGGHLVSGALFSSLTCRCLVEQSRQDMVPCDSCSFFDCPARSRSAVPESGECLLTPELCPQVPPDPEEGKEVLYRRAFHSLGLHGHESKSKSYPQ